MRKSRRYSCKHARKDKNVENNIFTVKVAKGGLLEEDHNMTLLLLVNGTEKHNFFSGLY